MEEKKTFGQKLEKFFTGRGFYIVLFLCIAVIGVSAWVLLFTDGKIDDAVVGNTLMPVDVFELLILLRIDLDGNQLAFAR